MERNGRPRRRLEAPTVAPSTITEIARRYFACAVALAKAMGVPMSETFLQAHRESISCCFIEAGRAGVRLPPAVQLPPLIVDAPISVSDDHLAPPDTQIAEASTNGEVPPPPLTAADLPTHIPAGLPCTGQAIAALKPAALHMLCGKVGLKALADKSLDPLHVALLRERAQRFEVGTRPEASANGA